MTESLAGKIVVLLLLAITAWLYIGLPILNLPGEWHAHGEILGVKYGEWLLFVATMGLWWATRQLVTGAEKTSERQLRAYVFVRPISTYFLYDGDTCRVTITYVMKNSGQTPAFQLIHFGEIQNLMVPTATPITIPAPVGPLSALSLGPGAEIESTVWGIMNVDKLKELGTSLKKIHVVGTAIYFDAFKKRRETQFCFYVENLNEILSSHTGIGGNGETKFWASQQHNGAN
ncbi:hypothetical protein NLM16_08940 [Bradyrhizobium brasilense]|uniref:hypothetical protein n=1 Tax=Bradyrhizobium brasilense TaxID=1419277 RepID=UPI00287740AD|nr:hypothetical protein [Bradyrhizobium brasilense]MCP3414224.1 hypothetical protein [Bradyrhizobium brasilense]